jgi:hypothetical protein
MCSKGSVLPALFRSGQHFSLPPTMREATHSARKPLEFGALEGDPPWRGRLPLLPIFQIND